ncbi:MAG: MFS transporter [Candidatus Thermoplasmatota archaeon]|nr:MFS transporter [Candidatus Thermoplasmatota archaeon]
MGDEETKSPVFNSLDNAPPNLTHFRITALSVAGTFLDGYDISIIGVALTIITAISAFSYASTPLGKGLMAASTVIGMLFGALSIGYVTDLRGRKFMYMWDMVIFIVFTALISVSFNFWSLFAFRLILGLAIGADYAIGATIISEFSPKKSRGKFLASDGLAWWVGAAFAYIAGYLLLPLGSNSWRLMFAIGIIPAIAVLVLRRKVPESARWLANQGNLSGARDIEKQVVGKSDEINSSRERVSFFTLFSSKYVKNTVYFGAAWFFYDVAFYGIGLFTPTILVLLGLTHSLSILGSAIFSSIAIIGSILCILTVDRWGRKPVTILGFLGMFTSLFVLAFVAFRIPKDAFAVGTIGALIASMYILFELTQSWGMGSTDFVYGQELFPTSIRATGQGWGTSISRIGAILGLTTFPTIVSLYGLGYGLLFFSVAGLIGMILTVFLAPETKNKTLEELTER